MRFVRSIRIYFLLFFQPFCCARTSKSPVLFEFDEKPFIKVTKLVSMLKFALGALDVMNVLPLEEECTL